MMSHHDDHGTHDHAHDSTHATDMPMSMTSTTMVTSEPMTPVVPQISQAEFQAMIRERIALYIASQQTMEPEMHMNTHIGSEKSHDQSHQAHESQTIHHDQTSHAIESQNDAHPMAGHHMIMPTITPDMPISTQQYLQANHDMHMGMEIEFTGTTDIDFLRGMIPHHQGAVDMANIVLEHGKNGRTKDLAQRILNAQKREIRWMNQMLDRIETNHGLHTHPDAPSTLEFKQQNITMHEGMNIDFSGNADIDFVKGMIPHHEGALAMARTVLKYGNDQNVRLFALDVITDQQREIREMKRWLKQLQMREAYNTLYTR